MGCISHGSTQIAWSATHSWR